MARNLALILSLAFIGMLANKGQFITAANPDFDTRTYGRKKLSDLVQDLRIFETKRDAANQLLIRRLD